MVSREYLTAKPERRADPWRVLLQDVYPLLINNAARLEFGAWRLAEATRDRPLPTLGAAVVVGIVLHRLWAPRRPYRRRA